MSSFFFKGKQITIADIAKTLGVAYVLHGSVRKSGARLRVAARLIRADNGYVVWSETYDRAIGRHLDGPGRHRRRSNESAESIYRGRTGTIDASHSPRPTLKTNTQRQSVNRTPAAVVLRLHWVERGSRSSILEIPNTDPSVPGVVHPKTEYTKRTQFDPLFSIKARNGSQIPPIAASARHHPDRRTLVKRVPLPPPRGAA